MKTPALTKLVVTALEDLKGQDIRVLDVKSLTPMTDTMVLCTGTSSRHVSALAHNVLDEAKLKGVRPLGLEGMDQGEWALVDLNGVLVTCHASADAGVLPARKALVDRKR